MGSKYIKMHLRSGSVSGPRWELTSLPRWLDLRGQLRSEEKRANEKGRRKGAERGKRGKELNKCAITPFLCPK